MTASGDPQTQEQVALRRIGQAASELVISASNAQAWMLQASHELAEMQASGRSLPETPLLGTALSMHGLELRKKNEAMVEALRMAAFVMLDLLSKHLKEFIAESEEEQR